jgi:transcriptional regulator with GAF, ATPase, and Fis domain
VITAPELSSDKTNVKAVPASWRRFLIGESPAIRQLCEIIELIAPKRVTVLISGETGTGKEVVARAIHAASPRSALPMVAVNCTALPTDLVESELFGHAKGAFTGAHANRTGRFEQAHRSTIFLDEIGDLPLEAQGKLLRVLQEQQFERVGSSETVRVDVRVIAASNVDLENAVEDRRFREDLYYRLNVVPIHLIPLRERREDIPLLLDYFLQKTCAAEGVPLKRVTDEALDYLLAQNWPGNVRQFEHTVQMALALSGDRLTLTAQDFTVRGRAAAAAPASVPTSHQPLVTVGRDGIDFDQVVSDFERSLVNQALAVSGGNKARAADLLRIKRTTLLAKMKVFEEGRPQVISIRSNERPAFCA